MVGKKWKCLFRVHQSQSSGKGTEVKIELATKGINAVQLQVSSKDGQSVLNVFPAAILSYREKEEVAGSS